MATKKRCMIIFSVLISALIAITAITLGLPQKVTYANGEEWAASVKIGEGTPSNYLSIEEAFAAANGAEEPAEITLLADVETAGTLTVDEGRNITLDLKGQMLKYENGEINNSVITVKGSFTLTDTAPSTLHRFTKRDDGLWVFDDSVDTGEEFFGGVITGGTGTKVYIGAQPIIRGGGVYVVGGGDFTMLGGTISGNDTYEKYNSFYRNGGGVFVDAAGMFTMTAGMIVGNTASYGGGVYVGSKSASFTMTGGQIGFNTTNRHGGGVYVVDGTFNVSGDPLITDNNVGDARENVAIYNRYNTIHVVGALEKDGERAQIGVTRIFGDACEIATGFTGENNPSGKKPSNYFTSDNKTYDCVYVSDEESGTVSIAEHNIESGECTVCHATQDLFWGFDDGVLTLSSYKNNPATPYIYGVHNGSSGNHYPNWSSSNLIMRTSIGAILFR